MSEIKVKTAADFVLPPSVVSKIDVSRLVSEAEQVDSALTAAMVRAKAGAEQVAQPVLSTELDEFLKQNELNLTGGKQWSELVAQLRLLKDTVPVIHMTFAVPADRTSLQELTQWVRTSVHPQAVIEVGLQPALVAGVYLRTPNHVHDLSLRSLLTAQHDVLVKDLEALRVVK